MSTASSRHGQDGSRKLAMSRDDLDSVIVSRVINAERELRCRTGYIRRGVFFFFVVAFNGRASLLKKRDFDSINKHKGQAICLIKLIQNQNIIVRQYEFNFFFMFLCHKMPYSFGDSHGYLFVYVCNSFFYLSTNNGLCLTVKQAYVFN